ncbi:MAG TPA: hypothetical protein PLD20_23295 [Blastocatellia bacterium]|nr:hypothetical protein [Blastocatellia bacterium]HMV86363.1 hypothetical protein [Blastocatellia bacterium]HMX27863.1 hypothetical protein [Blastocatellia bacterium]HMY74468.1 hypothetical protein [Blastocatellia bacterium]HMZ20878.1 hypothetical protein [Blastocatellia bacterium]
MTTQDGQRRWLVPVKAAERNLGEFNAATWEDEAGLRPLLVRRDYVGDSVDSLLPASW